MRFSYHPRNPTARFWKLRRDRLRLLFAAICLRQSSRVFLCFFQIFFWFSFPVHAEMRSFSYYKIYGPIISEATPDKLLRDINIWLNLKELGMKQLARIKKEKVEQSEYAYYEGSIAKDHKNMSVEIIVIHPKYKLAESVLVPLGYFGNIERGLQLVYKTDSGLDKEYLQKFREANRMARNPESNVAELRNALTMINFVNSSNPTFDSIHTHIILVKKLILLGEEIAMEDIFNLVFSDLKWGDDFSSRQMFFLYSEVAWAFSAKSEDLRREVEKGLTYGALTRAFLEKAIEIDGETERKSSEVFKAARVYQKKYLIESSQNDYNECIDTIKRFLHRYEEYRGRTRINAFLGEWYTVLERITKFELAQSVDDYVSQVNKSRSYLGMWKEFNAHLEKSEDILIARLDNALCLSRLIVGGDTSTCQSEE